MGLSIEQLLILLFTVFFPPFLCLVFCIMFLAATGKSFGIRKTYVNLLLRVFEWGKQRIEYHNKVKRTQSRHLLKQGTDDSGINSSSDDDDEDILETTFSETENQGNSECQNGNAGVTLKHLQSSGSNVLISKEASQRIRKISTLSVESSPFTGEPNAAWILVSDSLEFLKAGMECIIDDEVTSRFKAEELPSWNLLTRTSFGYHYLSLRLTLLYFGGFVLRYLLLFPARVMLFTTGLIWLVCSTAFIGYLPNGRLKRWMNWHASLISYRIMSRALSCIVTYHNLENMARPGGICVANHTSPIDVMILACDNCYALVGQKHGGLLGLIQRSLSRATSHVWFEREVSRDRLEVARRLREHVQDVNKLPILIFPEGTCINNTSVMQFKKGGFEASDIIYPVAIKYDSRFGDPFWNSSQQSYLQYTLMMMTSWAIVCDVLYLPPMIRQANETGIDFANRVKAKIASAGGLVDLEWDGQLKRHMVKPEVLEQQRKKYSQRIEKALQ